MPKKCAVGAKFNIARGAADPTSFVNVFAREFHAKARQI